MILAILITTVVLTIIFSAFALTEWVESRKAKTAGVIALVLLAMALYLLQAFFEQDRQRHEKLAREWREAGQKAKEANVPAWLNPGETAEEKQAWMEGWTGAK